MHIVHSRKVEPIAASSGITKLLHTITEAQLRQWVEHISVPRHFAAEPEQNRATAPWLSEIFESLGFRVERQGKFTNILRPPKTTFEDRMLGSAHYASATMWPGAAGNGV